MPDMTQNDKSEQDGYVLSEKKEIAETTEESCPEKQGLFRRIGNYIHGMKENVMNALQERAGEIKHAKAKRIIAGICIALGILIFVVFYVTIGVQIANFIKDKDKFRDWITGFDDLGGILIFSGLRIVQTVTRIIPAGPLQIAGGCAFGAWGGLLWCTVGSLVGTLVIFFLGRIYGMKLVGIFVSPEKMQQSALFKDKKRRNFILFIVNFLPGIPKDIFTWMASISGDRISGMVLVIVLGRTPAVLASTWCGAELMKGNYVQSGVIFVVMFLVGLIGSLFYKKFASKHTSEKDETKAE